MGSSLTAGETEAGLQYYPAGQRMHSGGAHVDLSRMDGWMDGRRASDG